MRSITRRMRTRLPTCRSIGLGIFFANAVPTATFPPQPSEAGMPDRFDGVMATYNAKAARGISAVRIFPRTVR
jgi:hypothetical protein